MVIYFVDLPMKKGDFPYLCKRLPEGTYGYIPKKWNIMTHETQYWSHLSTKKHLQKSSSFAFPVCLCLYGRLLPSVPTTTTTYNRHNHHNHHNHHHLHHHHHQKKPPKCMFPPISPLHQQHVACLHETQGSLVHNHTTFIMPAWYATKTGGDHSRHVSSSSSMNGGLCIEVCQIILGPCNYRRKFRSQTSDNMERWKAEQGRGIEKRKIRRKKSRRERVRRQKMQMREKVGKSRNTVFFQWFVAPEGRKVGSLKRRVRSQLATGEMKNCTPLWREAHLEVKSVKNWRSRSTFGSWDVEKVHGVVARSTFWSQNVQNTRGSDHFWKLRCRKSARRCGAKHILKSKCTKH